MGELRLTILEKQRVDDDDDKAWLFLIGKKSPQVESLEKILPFRKRASRPPSESRCIPIFGDDENDPYIYEEDAEAIRRRFPDRGASGGLTSLGLSR